MNLITYFYKAYPYRTLIACLMIAISSILTAITLTALPALLFKLLGKSGSKKAEIFDNALSSLGFEPNANTLLTALCLGIILQNLLLGGANIFSGFTKAKLVKDLRMNLLSAMANSEWKFYTKQPTGRISTALINEAERAGAGYVKSISILSSLVLILVYLSVAFFISWQIAIIALVTSLVLMLLFSQFVKVSKTLGREDSKILSSFNARLTDLGKGIKSLKAMSRQSHSNELLESSTKTMKSISKKSTVVEESLSSLQEIILMLTIIFTVYYSFRHLNLPIEFAVVLVFLYLRAMKTFGKAQKQVQKFATCIGSFENIINLLENAETHVEKKSGSLTPTLRKSILIDKISYSHSDRFVFDNFSSEIICKKLNTIIGPSGVGKTTLIDLICGLYTAKKGEIYIDDTPMSKINVHEWRKKIGYVVQETNLLNTNIKNNITLGDKSISNKDVFQALDRCYAMQFVDSLEKGINTGVGEGGCNLSGGQRQRILIARALIHNPELLILDEATSALDQDTEKSLSKLFKTLSSDITILAITHRPALAELSDNVIDLREIKSPHV